MATGVAAGTSVARQAAVGLIQGNVQREIGALHQDIIETFES